MVFVSHDRYFIDKLATRVFEVARRRRRKFIPGNYEDYLWRKEGGAEQLQQSVEIATAAPQPANGNHSQAAADSKSKRLNPIRRKQMEDRVRELEAQISDAERSIAECETALQTFVSAEETARLTQAIEKHRAELQKHLAEWEELAQALEA